MSSIKGYIGDGTVTNELWSFGPEDFSEEKFVHALGAMMQGHGINVYPNEDMLRANHPDRARVVKITFEMVKLDAAHEHLKDEKNAN